MQELRPLQELQRYNYILYLHRLNMARVDPVGIWCPYRAVLPDDPEVKCWEDSWYGLPY